MTENYSPEPGRLRHRLPLVHFVVDGAVWAVAFPLSMWLRYPGFRS